MTAAVTSPPSSCSIDGCSLSKSITSLTVIGFSPTAQTVGSVCSAVRVNRPLPSSGENSATCVSATAVADTLKLARTSMRRGLVARQLT